MANTAKPRSSSTSTTGPRGVSIATAISSGRAPVFSSSQQHSSSRPAPPCLPSRSATRLPSASSRQARCCSIAQSKPTNQRTSSFIVSTSNPRRATATFVDPCTGARGSNLLLDVVAASLPGHRSYSGARGTGWAMVAPGRLARSARLMQTGSSNARTVQGGQRRLTDVSVDTPLLRAVPTRNTAPREAFPRGHGAPLIARQDLACGPRLCPPYEKSLFSLCLSLSSFPLPSSLLLSPPRGGVAERRQAPGCSGTRRARSNVAGRAPCGVPCVPCDRDARLSALHRGDFRPGAALPSPAFPPDPCSELLAARS